MARRIDIARCYAILEVSQSATLDDVKSSYKRLALKYHPDKNGSPGATAKFQEIGSAYKAIIDHVERPTPEPNWSPHTGNFYPYDPYKDHLDDFFMDLEFSLFMFAFGYGRGNCPPPFNLRRHRPQKPNAERTTQEAREREEKAETKEKMWRQQKKKKRTRQTATGRERAKKPKETHQAKQGAACTESDESFMMARQKMRSTIFAAARGGRWEQVKKGISEDRVDSDGVEVLTGLEGLVPKPREPKETLLHLAVKEGVMDIFKWLVDHGSNTEARDSFARTSFHLALQYGHLPLINYILASFPPGSHSSQPILSPPPKASLLRLAIESNNLEVVRTVITQFIISNDDVTKEWRRLKDPAFANSFPISRSYGGGRGRTEVNNPNEWKEILQLLREYVSPAGVSSSVPHHSAPAPREGGWTPASRNPRDFSGKPISKPTGSHTSATQTRPAPSRLQSIGNIGNNGAAFCLLLFLIWFFCVRVQRWIVLFISKPTA